MYFAQRPIFEHSVSGVGNLPSHVIDFLNSYLKFACWFCNFKIVQNFVCFFSLLAITFGKADPVNTVFSTKGISVLVKSLLLSLLNFTFSDVSLLYSIRKVQQLLNIFCPSSDCKK